MAQYPNLVRVSSVATTAVLNLTADSVLKASSGTLLRIMVNATGTASGAASAAALYDYNTTGSGGTAASHLAVVVANAAGIYTLEWQCATGIRVVPAAGAILAVTLV